MKIRHAENADLDVLSAIEAASYPAAEGASRESIAKRLAAFPECFWLLENDAGEICAFINGFCTGAADLTDEMFDAPQMHDPHGAWQMIFSVVTAPAQRKKGYAAQTMRQVLADARARGQRGVVLTCKEGLLAFYAQFGFVDEGLSASSHGGAVWHQMRLTF